MRSIGNYKEAKKFCNSAYELASKGYSPQLQARSLTFLASIYRNQGDLKNALVQVEDGLSKIAKQSSSGYESRYRYDLAITLLELGCIHQDIGNVDECKKYFELSENTFESIESFKQANRVKMLKKY
jgi:tetratricopeptide (TPR) repeat protein